MKKVISALSFTAALALSSNVSAQTSASCPFTATEVKQTLGVDVKEGAAGKELPFAGGKMLTCRYESAKPFEAMLLLKQTLMDDAKNPANANSFKYLAGKLTLVPNDADGAGWQDNQGDMTNATLHYLRAGALVELRVTVSPRDKNYAEVRAKLPKMRRLPL